MVGANQSMREYPRKHYLSSQEEAQSLHRYHNPVLLIAKTESTLVEAVDVACNPWIPGMIGDLST